MSFHKLAIDLYRGFAALSEVLASGLGISEAEQRRGGSKGCCVGEDSFVSDKGDQLSESNLCQSKVDTDTDTTAGYESAEESDSSAFGNGSFVICRDGNSTLDIVGAQSSAPDALSVTQLVEDFESLSLQNQADRTLGNDDTAVSGDTITDVSVISTGAEVSICESVPSPVPSNSEQLNDGLRFTSYDVKLPIKESNLLHAGGNSEELNNSYAKDQRASNTAIEKEALPRQGELVKVADADNTISTLVSTEESLISTDFELSCVKRQQTPVNSSPDQECSTNIVKESEAKEQTALNLSVSKEPFLGIQDIQSDRVVDEIIKSSNEKPSVLNIVIDASIGELVNTNDTGIILNENINAKGDSSFRSGLTSLESSIVEAPVLSSEQLNVSENILPVEHSVGSQVEDSVAEEITVKQHIIEPTVEDTVVLKLQESPNVSLSNSESDVDQSILSQKTESNCSDVHDLITLLAAASLSDDKRGIEFDTSNKLSVTNVEESREESISKSSDESVSFKSIAEEVSGKLDDRESKRHFVGLSQTVEPLEISQTSSVEPGEPTDFCEKKVSDDNDAVNDAIEFIETTTPDRSSNDSFNLDKPNKGLSDPDTSSGSYNEASAVHSTTEEKQFALPNIVASSPVNTETIVSEVEETGSQNIKSEGKDIIKVDDVSDLVDSHFKSCKTNQSSLDLHTPTVISNEKTEEVKIIVDEIYENSNNALVDPSSNCDLIVHQISSVVTVKESPNSLNHKDKNFDTFEVVAKVLLNNSAEIKSDDLSHSSAGFQESTISNFAENFPVDLNNVNEVDVTSNVPADKLSNSCSVNQSEIISGVSHEIESDTRSTDVVPDSPLKDIGKTPVTESGVEILKVDSVNLSGDALPNHSIEELEVAENEIKEVLVAAEDSITILPNLTVAENCFSVQECSITAENNKTEDSLNPANPVQPEPHCHSPGLGLELSNCNTIAKNLSELTSDPSKGRIDISFESLPKNKESEPKGEPTGLANKESYLEPKSHFQSLETSEKITIELNSQESTGVTSENIIPEPKLQNSNLLDADQSDASVQEFRLHSPINLSTRADSLEPVVAEDALKTISKTNSQINFSGKENSLEVKGDTDLHTSFESVENSLSEETTGPLNLTQPINLSSKEKTVVETVAEGLKIYTPIQQVEHTHLSDINSCEPINLSAKEEQYLGESKSQNSEVLAFVEGLKTSDSVELKESASPVQSTKVSDQGLVSLSGSDEKFVNLTKSSELQINPGSIFVSGKEDSLEEVVGEPSLQQSYDISEFDDKVLNKTISQEAPMDLRQKQAKATNRMNGDHPPPVVKVTNRAPIRSAFSSTDSKPLKKQSDSVVKNGKIESVGRGVLDPKKGQEVRQKSKSPTEFDHRTEGKVARAKSKSPVGFADDTATKSSHVGSKVGLTSEGRCGSTTSKSPSPENEMVPAGVEKPSVELGKKLDKPNTHDSEKPKKPAFSGTKASEKSASVQPHQFLEPSNRPVKHITKRSDQEKKNVPLLQKPVEVPVVEIMETEAADSSNVCMMRSAVSPDINRSEAGPVTADENFQEGERKFILVYIMLIDLK
ncbi:hypothetical protein AAG570_002974 [Ranatra chinensis]|uniref:Uncharacterized protein n=1 Tax=Ranatra chinensis TaxID=642074 RepID=A0ABD0YJQ4_9HEMI